eukprot:584542-Amphidinium_carterae.1
MEHNPVLQTAMCGGKLPFVSQAYRENPGRGVFSSTVQIVYKILRVFLFCFVCLCCKFRYFVMHSLVYNSRCRLRQTGWVVPWCVACMYHGRSP